MIKNNQGKGLALIRITLNSRDAIKDLAEKKGLKMITVLEYILSGQIKIKELWSERNIN